MRTLIVQQWVTADGIAAEEDGGLGFVTVDPFSEASDPAWEAELTGFVDSVDTMLLGATTYAQAAAYWPTATDQGEYGEKVNSLAKVVASTSLEAAPWGDLPAASITADAVATVRELKEQPGGDIWLWGSLRLMHSLLDAGVVDEVRMLVCPVSLGAGTRLFQQRHDLRLLEASAFANGLSLVRYAVTA